MGWRVILKKYRPARTEAELLERIKRAPEYGGYVDMEGNWVKFLDEGPETPLAQTTLHGMDRGDFTSAYDLMVEVLKKEGQATLKRLIEAAEKSTYIVSDKEIKAILDNSPDIKEKENGVYVLEES